jgi:hypothetical protein
MIPPTIGPMGGLLLERVLASLIGETLFIGGVDVVEVDTVKDEDEDVGEEAREEECDDKGEEEDDVLELEVELAVGVVEGVGVAESATFDVTTITDATFVTNGAASNVSVAA